MVMLSMTFGYFTKVAFKSYGSTIHENDVYLTSVAQSGFMTAAISRFVWASVQEVIGFKPVYVILLLI